MADKVRTKEEVALDRYRELYAAQKKLADLEAKEKKAVVTRKEAKKAEAFVEEQKVLSKDLDDRNNN